MGKEDQEGKRQGGNRQGAGRPRGTGKFGKPTKAVRLPVQDVEPVLRWIENKRYRLPLYQERINAGFPSPASDEVEEHLDLNERLIKHPYSTFFLKVSGSSMIKAGIFHNDLLIVDRSLTPSHGKIVIAAVNGELTVKRLCKSEGRLQLVAENEEYPPIEIHEGMELHIWGVVTYVIHAL